MKIAFNKKRIAAIIGLVGVLCLAFYIWFSHGKLDLSEIQSEGVLRVSTDYNSIDYFVKGDSTYGFQYEMINALCDSLGVKPEWHVENSLNKNTNDLNAGRIDIIARNIPVTTELRRNFAFSIPVLHFTQVLVQRKAEYNHGKAPLRDQLMLAKKIVYVPSNSPSILRLKNLSSEIADTIYIKEMPDYESEQLMMMVANGDIDFAVCDARIAKINALLLPEVDVETAISFTQMQSWAMRKSSPHLKNAVDKFLKHFLQTKAYRDIYRKYYK
jgi:membrane-bound lytic murein transglycosylase MltF